MLHDFCTSLLILFIHLVFFYSFPSLKLGNKFKLNLFYHLWDRRKPTGALLAIMFPNVTGIIFSLLVNFKNCFSRLSSIGSLIWSSERSTRLDLVGAVTEVEDVEGLRAEGENIWGCMILGLKKCQVSPNDTIRKVHLGRPKYQSLDFKEIYYQNLTCDPESCGSAHFKLYIRQEGHGGKSQAKNAQGLRTTDERDSKGACLTSIDMYISGFVFLRGTRSNTMGKGSSVLEKKHGITDAEILVLKCQQLHVSGQVDFSARVEGEWLCLDGPSHLPLIRRNKIGTLKKGTGWKFLEGSICIFFPRSIQPLSSKRCYFSPVATLLFRRQPVKNTQIFFRIQILWKKSPLVTPDRILSNPLDKQLYSLHTQPWPPSIAWESQPVTGSRILFYTIYLGIGTHFFFLIFSPKHIVLSSKSYEVILIQHSSLNTKNSYLPIKYPSSYSSSSFSTLSNTHILTKNSLTSLIHFETTVKVPGSFCCYSNHSAKLIQPSFDAQSLCSLHSDCAKKSTYANMWSLDGSLDGACFMSTAGSRFILIYLFLISLLKDHSPSPGQQVLEGINSEAFVTLPFKGFHHLLHIQPGHGGSFTQACHRSIPGACLIYVAAPPSSISKDKISYFGVGQECWNMEQKHEFSWMFKAQKRERERLSKSIYGFKKKFGTGITIGTKRKTWPATLYFSSFAIMLMEQGQKKALLHYTTPLFSRNSCCCSGPWKVTERLEQGRKHWRTCLKIGIKVVFCWCSNAMKIQYFLAYQGQHLKPWEVVHFLDIFRYSAHVVTFIYQVSLNHYSMKYLRNLKKPEDKFTHAHCGVLFVLQCQNHIAQVLGGSYHCKRNLLNCLQLTCIKSNETLGVTPTFLPD
ncbi:hypothetical protein VP01_1585g2 [Puccinia sorghi]|uniref:Uncharacterized protein n=1 Tax=Puccinia sorghi TaxID=27349 RepID=A0A0L6VJE6_9BASI|nr:hypothetical protein VP01_1585g2 [Puccinia sorghi]